MISVRTLVLAAALAGAASAAHAQAAAPAWPAPPPPPGQAPAPQAAAPQAATPRPAAPPQGQASAAPQGQMPPCFNEFLPLRQEAEKRAAVLKGDPSKRKLTQPEACQAFKSFAAAEAKVVQFVDKNSVWCGIPADAVKVMKANHAKTVQIRDQVCNGARPGPGAAPSLSDALGGGARIPDSTNTRTGQGTFDTLTGNPLAR